MSGNSKRYRSDRDKVDAGQAFPLGEAARKLKEFATTKFDQSVDLVVHLGVDPKQADQNIRGSVSLPHGTGQTRRVIAFCTDDKVEAAKGAGAIEAGGEDLVKKIQDGWMEFDVAVASPDMMRVISKLGKVLGPRGLMPSPKAGTVTPDVAQAVTEYAAGKVEFRNDSGGNIHVPVGKMSFSAEQLEENADHLIQTLMKMKPASAKGQYVKKIGMSGTMTPSVLIEA